MTPKKEGGGMDETQRRLDDLLIAWHKWAKGYQHVGGINSSPAFRDAKTSRGWDTVADIVDGEIHHSVMESIDFNVMQLEPDYRTALQIQARNLATGRYVWTSPRLPNDIESRAQLLGLARVALIARLMSAGVLENTC